MSKIEDLKKKIEMYFHDKKSQKDISEQYRINCRLAEEIAMLEANKKVLEAGGMGRIFKYCVATRSNNLLALYDSADTFDDYIEYFISWNDGFTISQRIKFLKMARRKGQCIDKERIQAVLDAPEPDEDNIKRMFGERDKIGKRPWSVKLKFIKTSEVSDNEDERQ